MIRRARVFAQLRWRVFAGALRSNGSQRWTVVIGTIASVFIGVAAAMAFAVVGSTADDGSAFFVLAPTAVAIGVVALGVVAGISQPIDPRQLATEPLTDRQLGFGLLVTTATGPPGLSGLLVAIGLGVGGVRGWSSVPITTLASLGFALTLLLLSRSSINALGWFATRYPRAGQVVVALTALFVYGGFQLAAPILRTVDGNQQRELARVLAFTPPGQLGRAIEQAGPRPAIACAHLVAGVAWLPVLAYVFVRTTRALVTSVPITRSARRRRPSAGASGSGFVARVARAACGGGPTGAVAWRSVLTRVRTPKSALETFTGGGLGLGMLMVPVLARDEAGAGAVLVGGAVQLAVLFMAGNCFGADGPAFSNELLCGVDPALLIGGKARSVMVVASPIAAFGPVLAAALTGEWSYLPAGWLVACGGLMAGAGGAMVQSTMMPVAEPNSDNPLATGDAGKGCIAGLVLAVVIIGLALATLPVALALYWAVRFGSLSWVTLCAVLTIGAGALVLRGGLWFAARHWRRHEPEIYAAVIPAR